MGHKTHVALWLTAGFALFGGLFTSYTAPKFLTWYFDPPAQFGINCVAPIEWALTRLLWAQFTGIFMGAVIGLLIFYFWMKRQHPKAHVTPPQTM